jgi:hypothetical protein
MLVVFVKQKILNRSKIVNQVFVVYYDERYKGIGERGPGQRKIEGVFDSAEKARERMRKLESMAHVGYVDFDAYEVE